MRRPLAVECGHPPQSCAAGTGGQQADDQLAQGSLAAPFGPLRATVSSFNSGLMSLSTCPGARKSSLALIVYKSPGPPGRSCSNPGFQFAHRFQSPIRSSKTRSAVASWEKVMRHHQHCRLAAAESIMAWMRRLCRDQLRGNFVRMRTFGSGQHRSQGHQLLLPPEVHWDWPPVNAGSLIPPPPCAPGGDFPLRQHRFSGPKAIPLHPGQEKLGLRI